MSSPSNLTPHDAYAETVAWLWLAYHSGLALRRSKAILHDVRQRFSSLHAALASDSLHAATTLSEQEKMVLARYDGERAHVQQQLQDWARLGISVLRQDEALYPDTLRRHLPGERQPLLLHVRGESGLLDMPLVRPWAGEADEEAGAWCVGVLQELAAAGALPLLLARPGLDALVVRRLLAEQTPFALVLAQGLAGYQPPPALKQAVEEHRALLISPFAPSKASSPELRGPTSAFTQALAHALLLLAPPYPAPLLPEQPCFLRPGIPKTVACTTYYVNAEDFFVHLLERPAAAQAALAEAAAPAPPPAPPAEPVDPEALIAQLERLGHVPEAMKQRLRSRHAGHESRED